MNAENLLDCDALEQEARQILHQFSDAQSLLLNFANDLKSIDARLKCNESAEYADSLNETMKQLIRNNKAVQNHLTATKKTLEVDVDDDIDEEDKGSSEASITDLNAVFERNLKTLNTKINFNNDAKMKELTKILSQPADEGEDLRELEPAEFRIPVDPFTKKQIENPVKNTTCGHIYDKESFRNYLTSFASNPRRLICPIAGCLNKQQLSEGSVEEDIELRFKIRAHIASGNSNSS